MQNFTQNKWKEIAFVVLAVFALLWAPGHTSASVITTDVDAPHINQTIDDDHGLHAEVQRPSPRKCFDIFHYSGTATTRTEQRPSKQSKPSGLVTFLLPLSIGSAKHCSQDFGLKSIKHDSLSVLSRSMRNRN